MKSLRKESNRPAAVALASLGSFLLSGGALGANYPAPVQGDYVIRNFEFAGGERLPELKLHYFTSALPLGTPIAA